MRKQPPPRTLQQAYAYGPTVVLVGGLFQTSVFGHKRRGRGLAVESFHSSLRAQWQVAVTRGISAHVHRNKCPCEHMDQQIVPRLSAG